MDTLTIGQALVALSNADRADLAVEERYADNIISIEPVSAGQEGQRVEGKSAVRDKHLWWYDNHEIHSAVAGGPYVGQESNQFVVRFAVDLTPRGGQRAQFEELGVYTVAAGKIVREEFFNLVSG